MNARLLLALVLLLSGPTARAAAEGAPESVVELVPDGRIDWSRMVLEVDVDSDLRVGAWMDRRVQEQDALDRLGPRVARLAQRVRVTPDTLAADLLDSEGELARRLEESIDDWQVVETRYLDSGRVELTAELDLRTWLRPALRSLASSAAVPPGPGQATGILVDARTLPFEPCMVPRIISPTGTVLFGAQRLSAAALELDLPVIYVQAPGDARAVARAGEHPILVRAVSVQGGGELVLEPLSASTLERHPDLADLAARGRVVVVTGALAP